MLSGRRIIREKKSKHICGGKMFLCLLFNRSWEKSDFYQLAPSLSTVDLDCNAIVLMIDCKTIRIFAYLNTRKQSNKRSERRLKTESETGQRRYKYFFSLSLASHTSYGRVRPARFACVRLLRHTLPISLLILR